MKKLLVLALVLGCVASVNATMVLSIVDNLDGTFGIDVSGYTGSSDNMYWAAASAGSVPTGGVLGAVVPVDAAIWDDAVGAGFVPLPVGENGVWGFIGDVLSGTPVAGSIYFDSIQANIGDTIVLYNVAADWSGVTPLDTVTLVPEPATMLILGLGGLLLRRKK